MKKINLSHRAAFLVLLLVFTVALTTALVLAGESGNKGTRLGASGNAIFAQVRTESCAWELR